jgi:HTH-type transcriptional regulator / antitoxin HigA
MNIHPLKNEKDYREALKEIRNLWDTEPNTPKGDRLEVIMTLVEAYEGKHYKIAPPDPIEAIKFRMEQQGLRNSDVAPYFGGNNRVSEVLRGKRKLTAKMMIALHNGLGIPADSLLHSGKAA